MATSDKLGLSLLVAGQASADITVNRYLFALEALTGGSKAQQTTPPATPVNGDVYLVTATATDDWTGQEDSIAVYQDGWIYLTPYEGLALYNQDDGLSYRYESSAWAEDTAAGGGGTTSFEITNGTNVLTAGYPVVHNGTELDQPDPAVSDNAERFLGFTEAQVLASATATIIPPGSTAEYVSWSWSSIGSPIYWTAATTLTQLKPLTGIRKKVGIALSATKILVLDSQGVNLGS